MNQDDKKVAIKKMIYTADSYCHNLQIADLEIVTTSNLHITFSFFQKKPFFSKFS
jgi:hypothetical protein